ncbi:type I restriction-modification system subunit M N-terminal domain-containing protein [Xanthomonas citri pv. malvacearum]|uniref:type I restriction-modification system subunit M N-terminal domain-containing protein n=1 Tax=Xanthomonas TaxID=338 RepID=UPI0031B62A04
MRGQVDAAESKHVVLGLLFLKYISDSFDARRDELKAERAPVACQVWVSAGPL